MKDSWLLIYDRQGADMLGLVYDKKNDEQRKKAHKLITLLIDDCAKEGYGEYRTHLGTFTHLADPNFQA
jgi:hypothetical protein